MPVKKASIDEPKEKKQPREFTDADCLEWKKNKLVNPISKYSITKTGTVYKKFAKICRHIETPINSPGNTKIIDEKNTKGVFSKLLNTNITKQIYKKWLEDKLKNPITGYKIGETSKIYKEYEKFADIFKKTKIEPKIEPKVESPKKDAKEEVKKEPKKETKNIQHKLKRDPTDEECLKWKKNKLVNPTSKTKSIIKEKGSIYNELEEKCKHIKTPKNTPDKTPIEKPKKKVILFFIIKL